MTVYINFQGFHVLQHLFQVISIELFIFLAIVIDGEGWRPGALEWLMANSDDVMVFNLKEFKEFMNGT